MKIKKGDTVKILVGKDAGRQGRVLKVLAKEKKVVVDGLNLFKKHVKGDNRNKRAAIIDIAKPVDVSNVILVCPSCSKPARIARKEVDGSLVRVCKKCGKSVESGSTKAANEGKTATKKTAKSVEKKVETKKEPTVRKSKSKTRTSIK